MFRMLLCLFVIISMGCVWSDYSKAQALPTHNGSSNTINTQPTSTTNPSQCQPQQSEAGAKRNRRQQIPKPEQNKLSGGGGKKNNRKKKRKKLNNNKKKIPKQHKTYEQSEAEDHQPGKKKNGQQELTVQSERVDDIPLLIEAMIRMGIQEAIDKYIAVQKNQRDLSWGWTAVIWLAYILSEGDHRKVAVQEYIAGMENTLREITEMEVSILDFTDDRLTNLCKYLARDELWSKIEVDISRNSIEAYELPKETCRIDATTVSGYHETVEDGMFQFGNSKDDPNRPQIKVMTGSLDPLGMPLATDVVSGERADDGLYAPIISRIKDTLQKEGVLYVGDCKLSSLENRLHIREKIKGHYLSPLPNTGRTSEEMKKWVEKGNEKDEEDELEKYIVINNNGEEELKAKGYELEREQSGEIDGKQIKWQERVLIVKSPAHEEQKEKGLERRLKNAEKALYGLTPPRGPGKRQIKEKGVLIESANAVLKNHRVEGFLTYDYVKEVEQKTKYVGKGRGSAKREKIVEEKIRYQITEVFRNKEKIKSEKKIFGWKAYVTDVTRSRLGLIDAVKSYRKQYRVERVFNRLKSRLKIAPLYVKRKDQIKGITHLLTLGVRVYTLIEFVVRRSLERSNQKLFGLHLENPKKATAIPTCERLLKGFSKITLSIVSIGDNIMSYLTPLSQLQTDILNHLGLSITIYDKLSKLRN